MTFNAREALKAGKRVFYMTTVGVFRLTSEGLELEQVMPGIDVERDIVRATSARFVVPERPLPSVAPEIVSGKGFTLMFEDAGDFRN